MNHTINLLQLSSKVLVSEIRRVVILNELDDFGFYPIGAFPVAPEPLRHEAWHAKHAKMYEDANLGIVVPLKENPANHYRKLLNQAQFQIFSTAARNTKVSIKLSLKLPCTRIEQRNHNIVFFQLAFVSILQTRRCLIMRPIL